MMDKSAHKDGVKLGFGCPGTPTPNAKAVTFKGKLLARVPDGQWFVAIDDAWHHIEDGRQYYTRLVRAVHYSMQCCNVSTTGFRVKQVTSGPAFSTVCRDRNSAATASRCFGKSAECHARAPM
ncbi:MAG: hypothetical protein NVSMB6_11810 [Burkholderiaceae bacterium]